MENENIYVDWGIKKPHSILIGNSRKVIEARLTELDIKNSKIFLERGCPRAELYYLISNNNEVYQIGGHKVKEYRKGEKSDKNDVKTIRKLAITQPKLFVRISKKEQEEITEIALYKYYMRITQVCASLKNQQKAFKRDFGIEHKTINNWIKSLNKEKYQLLKKFENKYKRIEHIKGFGKRYVTGLMITANPKKFKSLSAYLRYCGYKGICREDWKYNRHAKILFHEVATQTIRHKDKNFYPFYLKLKLDLTVKKPEYPKYRINNMAINRLATFLAKEFYDMFGNDKRSILPLKSKNSMHLCHQKTQKEDK